ncbi:MAG TPA: hypothetical protein VIH35_01520 [Kiritimatiellia bacterium]|jgi:hypothetical protein
MQSEVPVKGGDMDLQGELIKAFEAGLRIKFGELVGEVMTNIILYHHGESLNATRVRELVESDAGSALNSIVLNRVDGGTMRCIRACTIGSAILDDKDAVARWATEGLNRSKSMDGEWPATVPQWQWILGNTYMFIYYARQIKRAFNQM